MSEAAHQNHTEKKAFLVDTSSLREVRTFCRDVFEKLQIQQELKDELVLAIACLLYTSPSPRDRTRSRMPSSA